MVSEAREVCCFLNHGKHILEGGMAAWGDTTKRGFEADNACEARVQYVTGECLYRTEPPCYCCVVNGSTFFTISGSQGTVSLHLLPSTQLTASTY
jgi:hypothetical protein